jgi:hydrogenase maturation protease
VAPDSVLIIGYGNPLRGDDGAGPLAAKRLAARGFRTIDVHQLTPELAEPVATARSVVFLDAHADLAPGRVLVKRLNACEEPRRLLEHHASPGGLLRLARTVYGAEPEAWLIEMGGEDFELSDQISPAADRAVARAIREVMRCMNRESSRI